MEYTAHILKSTGEIKITGVGNWKLDDVVIVSKSGLGDASTIEDGLALTDGVTKTMVLVDCGAYNEIGLSIPGNVSVMALSRGCATVSSSDDTDAAMMTCLGGNYIINLEMAGVGGSTFRTVIDVTGYNVYVENCSIAMVGSTTGNYYAIKSSHNTGYGLHINECDLTASSVGGGTGYCYSGQGNGGETDVFGGVWGGMHYGAEAQTGHSITFAGMPKVTGGSLDLTGAGTFLGTYINAVDNTIIKGSSVYLDSGEDVFPGGDVVGLDERWTNLVGANPADDYHWTWRNFLTNDFAGYPHVAGFEDSQASPYSFGGSPGGFSVSVPANTEIKSNYQPHHLTLRDLAGTGCYLQWTSSTARTFHYGIYGISPLVSTSDYHLMEIRMWAVQAPARLITTGRFGLIGWARLTHNTHYAWVCGMGPG